MSYVRPRILRTEYTLPWSPTDRDILMDRRPVYDPDADQVVGVVERWNLPHELSPILGVSMGWGGDVAGGLVAALNILDCWLPAGPGDVCVYYGVPVPCRQLALDLMPAFRAAHLLPLGWHGGVIPGGRIGQWIAHHRGAYELEGIDLAAVDDGRYPDPDGSFGG